MRVVEGSCIASGPGKDMFESTKIIAERQYKKAYELFFNFDGGRELTGPVQFVHQWIDMSNYTVHLPDGSLASTCMPALGYSFAAGTTGTTGGGSMESPSGDVGATGARRHPAAHEAAPCTHT